MHTVTIVLIPRDAPDPWRAGAERLARHRIIDDDLARPGKLDDWTVGSGSIADRATAEALGLLDDPDLARNVCFADRLPADFVPGALVTLDGAWYDLEDLGWRLVDGDTPSNRLALEAWADRVRSLLARHEGCLAVEFDAHA